MVTSDTGAADRYRPPAPRPMAPTAAVLRALLAGERDLLALLPAAAYRQRLGRLGVSRRTILLVNDPAVVRRILGVEAAGYPKNDLFVGALAPLIGDGIFISSGEAWRRQRRMVEPAFSHMHVGRAFVHMAAAVDALEQELDAAVAAGRPVAIDAATSRLAADIMVRTIFSRSLDSRAAADVFRQFERFQKAVANVRVLRLLLGRPWAPVRQPAAARAAAARLRGLLHAFIAPRLAAGPDAAPSDICGDMIAARDPDSGDAFSLDALVDQIGVFFLAGHETSASTIAWALFLLSQQPHWLARVRAEVQAVCGDGPVTVDHTRALPVLRAVSREVLRLYPPGPFLPRVALRPAAIDGIPVPRGGMVMISPWLLHRHEALWDAPDRFDPARFLDGRDKAVVPGSYIPFGLGPRVCVGAAFATAEILLVLARLLRRYELSALTPARVRPVARLTIASATPITMRLSRLA